MKAVVDTNILVSFFKSNPVNLIISSHDSFKLELFIPEQVKEELLKNQPSILKYAKISSEEFNKRLSKLEELVSIELKDSFKEFEPQARSLSHHDKDIPVFALALKLNCPIWSNELSFKEQSKIKVFSTKDMIELFL
jgi:predicted nucleic acid-binding protein